MVVLVCYDLRDMTYAGLFYSLYIYCQVQYLFKGKSLRYKTFLVRGLTAKNDLLV